MRGSESNNRKGVTEMLTVILFITTIICAFGWLICRVTTMALIKYLSDKGYTPPSDEETKACCKYALRKLLHIS